MLMRSCIKILDEKYNLMIKRRDTIDKYDILVAYHFIIQFKKIYIFKTKREKTNNNIMVI